LVSLGGVGLVNSEGLIIASVGGRKRAPGHPIELDLRINAMRGAQDPHKDDLRLQALIRYMLWN